MYIRTMRLLHVLCDLAYLPRVMPGRQTRGAVLQTLKQLSLLEVNLFKSSTVEAKVEERVREGSHANPNDVLGQEHEASDVEALAMLASFRSHSTQRSK